MRHDLLGADLQMLHLVEHRIEDNLLRARADELLNLLRALCAAAPDRNFRSEIGVLVTPTEPFPDAPLAARLVIVDGEINPLGEMKRLRIALRFIEKTSESAPTRG